MKRVKTKKKWIASYENGSDLTEIAKYLKSQMLGFEPVTYPKGAFGAAYGLQGGALASQMIGITGQRTAETPFTPNPSDVTATFQKKPGSSLALLDNFFQGQQGALARSSAASGANAYDTANILAGSIDNAARVRSGAAVDLQNENIGLDRARGQFNINIDQGVQASQNLEQQNENQKLAMTTGKLSEGLAAFGNLNNETFLKKQQVEQMNNAKLTSLMNQLFTVNYLNKLYQ